MIPNQIFLTYFPDEVPPVFKDKTGRSICLRVGSNIVIGKIVDEYHLPALLGIWFRPEDLDLLLNLSRPRILLQSKYQCNG